MRGDSQRGPLCAFGRDRRGRPWCSDRPCIGARLRCMRDTLGLSARLRATLKPAPNRYAQPRTAPWARPSWVRTARHCSSTAHRIGQKCQCQSAPRIRHFPGKHRERESILHVCLQNRSISGVQQRTGLVIPTKKIVLTLLNVNQIPNSPYWDISPGFEGTWLGYRLSHCRQHVQHVHNTID